MAIRIWELYELAVGWVGSRMVKSYCVVSEEVVVDLLCPMQAISITLPRIKITEG